MHTPEEVTLKALEQAKSVNADCYVSPHWWHVRRNQA